MTVRATVDELTTVVAHLYCFNIKFTW